ncbi:hypothetical protein M0Q50_10725 [bacterium]|jgi:hypothetical protein|nr:hypothetical protein [bacterium]
MLIDNVLYFLKLSFNLKSFIRDHANEIFNENYALKLRISQQSGFLSFDDIQLVKYNKTREEIYKIYKDSEYNLCEQISKTKKLIGNRIFNVWENDVLVHRSICEIEKQEQRIKKLKSLY